MLIWERHLFHTLRSKGGINWGRVVYLNQGIYSEENIVFEVEACLIHQNCFSLNQVILWSGFCGQEIDNSIKGGLTQFL